MNLTRIRPFIVTVIPFLITLFYSSCKDPFQYNPNEIVLSSEEKDLNRKNIEKILEQPVSDTLKFLLISDTHHEYEYLDEFVNIANGFDDISFVLVSGDITDFGLQFEYKATNDILKKLKKPYVTAVGNHDLLGNGTAVFNEMFGKTDFSFNYNRNKFVVVNSNSREYNFNGKIPDIEWLNNELSDTVNFDKLFIMGHIAPMDSDFDAKLEDAYVKALTDCGKVKVTMHGHTHNYFLGDYYSNGIDLLITRDMRSRAYVLFKVWNNDFSIEPKTF